MSLSQRLSSLFIVGTLCLVFAPFANAQSDTSQSDRLALRQDLRSCRQHNDTREEKFACARSVLEAHKDGSPRIVKKLEHMDTMKNAHDTCKDHDTREEKKACFKQYAEENGVELHGRRKHRMFFSKFNHGRRKLIRGVRQLPEETRLELRESIQECRTNTDDRKEIRACVREVVEQYKK